MFMKLRKAAGQSSWPSLATTSHQPFSVSLVFSFCYLQEISMDDFDSYPPQPSSCWFVTWISSSRALYVGDPSNRLERYRTLDGFYEATLNYTEKPPGTKVVTLLLKMPARISRSRTLSSWW